LYDQNSATIVVLVQQHNPMKLVRKLIIIFLLAFRQVNSDRVLYKAVDRSRIESTIVEEGILDYYYFMIITK